MCFHNELELESKLDVSGFEPTAWNELIYRIDFRPEHLSPSFSTKNKFSLVTCGPVNTTVLSPRSTSSYSIQIVQPLPELHELVLHAVIPTLFLNDKKHTVMITNKLKEFCG